MVRTHDLRGDKYIDGRDLIARLEELRSDRDNAIEEGEQFDEELAEELGAMEAIEDELPSRGDSETLIREDYFVEYAQQLAEDIGAISGNENWPLTCIDWDKAADELRQDYTSIEFGEFTYYMRAV
jgi:hypothetical protein